MKLVEYLLDSGTRSVFLPATLVALALVVLMPALSVFVAIKRMAFLGQGVSHAAFGGVGIALSLGLVFPLLATGWGVQAVVMAFCLAAAFGISRLSRVGGTDTAIGIVLAVSMALGFLLYRVAANGTPPGEPPPPPIEAVLFGSVLAVTGADAVVAWLAAVGIGLTIWLRRHSLSFWAFDESGAEAFGVNSEAMRTMLVVLIAVAVVITTRLAGVVLATALLIIPGASALRLATRMPAAIMWSSLVSLIGVLGGLIISVEFDLEPAPAIVLVLALAYSLARMFGHRA
ncbi:MAG: metal ABC transporter permease [Planctomycetota bacterium]